jgi:hypothetical protein
LAKNPQLWRISSQSEAFRGLVETVGVLLLLLEALGVLIEAMRVCRMQGECVEAVKFA